MRTRMTQGAWRAMAWAFGLGLLGAAVWLALLAFGWQAMPSYLAGWLFWMALPLGALPLVLLMELLGLHGWAVLPVLRRLLLLLPVGAVLAVPVMLGVAPLYHRPGIPGALPAAWMASGFLIGRMVAALLVWTIIALIFCRPPPRGAPRRGLAVLGLLLHLAIGSLAAVDWVMSLQPGLGSSAFGLLVITAQASAALCFAVFLLAVSTPAMAALPAEVPPVMAAALGAWVFLHFVQFLVVWSANLPEEIVWYQHRSLGLGLPAVWTGFAAAVLALAALLPYRFARVPTVMASVAAMLLFAHMAEMLWLVTPAFRGAFRIALPDLPALVGLGGLVIGLLLAIPASIGGEERHAPVRA